MMLTILPGVRVDPQIKIDWRRGRLRCYPRYIDDITMIETKRREVCRIEKTIKILVRHGDSSQGGYNDIDAGESGSFQALCRQSR